MSVNYDSINKKVSDYLKQLSGNVSLKKLFPDEFIISHSKYSNIFDFLAPTEVTDQKSFDLWVETTADEYVKSHTDFDSWNEMCKTAAIAFMNIKKQMIKDGTWEDETFTSEPTLTNICIHIGFC